MNTATVVKITPKGGYDGQFGYMYTFEVELDDNITGEASSKSETPPYKPGTQIWYEIKSTDPKYGHKLKISTKPPQGQQANPRPVSQPRQANPATSVSKPVKTQGTASNGAPTASVVHPATAGCAFKAAVDVFQKEGLSVGSEVYDFEVWRLASRYVRILQDLEAGKLAQPKAVQQAMQQAAEAGFVPQDDDVPF